MKEEITGWFRGRIPDGWFTEAPEIDVDRDEILVIGRLAAPEVEGDEDAQKAAGRGRIERWREETRAERMQIARAAEHAFGRKVSWGARAGDAGMLFTHVSSPVMTRLRMKERKVLDTLIDGGVARSRSEALAWCVSLVAEKEAEWLDELRDAFKAVDEARAKGPTSRRSA